MADMIQFAGPLPQTVRMAGRKYHRSSNAGSMFGVFYSKPNGKSSKAWSGYDWRTMSGKSKRWAKRQLAQFRRRDGKRFVMEGMATLMEIEAQAAADEAARAQAQYEADNRYNPDDEYQYDYAQEYVHDGVDYSAEAEHAEWYRRESWRDRDYSYYDDRSDPWWMSDPYERGIEEGWRRAREFYLKLYDSRMIS